jgi:hypothetical protein
MEKKNGLEYAPTPKEKVKIEMKTVLEVKLKGKASRT